MQIRASVMFTFRFHAPHCLACALDKSNPSVLRLITLPHICLIPNHRPIGKEKII